jgi:hypothetical protein
MPCIYNKFFTRLYRPPFSVTEPTNRGALAAPIA